MHKDYINENLLNEIDCIVSKDDRISTIYKETRIKGCRIFLSRMVGVVHLASLTSKINLQNEFKQSELLFYIEALKVLNEVHMEQNGK